jgi:hypothetical protein
MKKGNYRLSHNVIETIIDPILIKGLKNRDIVKSMIVNTFSSHNIETLLEIISKQDKYLEFYRDCYVSLIPPSFWKGVKYEEDILADYGLITSDNKLYGQIKQDTSWDDDKFNPFHSMFKVDIFILNDKKKLIIKQEEVHANNLFLLPNKETIKYFKAKSIKNGKDI